MQIPSSRASIPAPPRRVHFAESESDLTEVIEVPLAAPSPARQVAPRESMAPRPGSTEGPIFLMATPLRSDPYDWRWVAGVLTGGALGGIVVGVMTGSLLGSLTGAESTAEALRMFVPAGLGAGLAIAGVVVAIKRARRLRDPIYQII
ncbi:MAG TPA: hypothetical protein VFH51_10265 [Myxococcota bacterium]|nr:hypothetical protein [Myxococcota bacterium]